VNDDDWTAQLNAEQYKVLRGHGTEDPFSGTLLDNDETGDYACAGCGLIVFKSGAKFEFGSGWLSFDAPAALEAIRLVEDLSESLHRVEVQCSSCGGHLGHVFNDAPSQPTGMRFSVNSIALDFEPKN
jgi:peptide-methionine (R)-S-oxide reductase